MIQHQFDLQQPTDSKLRACQWTAHVQLFSQIMCSPWSLAGAIARLSTAGCRAPKHRHVCRVPGGPSSCAASQLVACTAERVESTLQLRRQCSAEWNRRLLLQPSRWRNAKLLRALHRSTKRRDAHLGPTAAGPPTCATAQTAYCFTARLPTAPVEVARLIRTTSTRLIQLNAAHVAQHAHCLFCSAPARQNTFNSLVVRWKPVKVADG